MGALLIGSLALDAFHRLEELMDDRKNAVLRFWELWRKNPWIRAAAASIPTVGPGLVQLMSADDRKVLLTRFDELTADLKVEVLEGMKALERNNRPNAIPILAIGSGNEEHVLITPSGLEVVLGQKHPVDEAAERYGGSCVNYSLRLLSYGVPVLPIVSIGNDKMGRCIQQQLISTAQECCPSEPVLEFLQSDAFFTPGVNTPHTTVLVHGPHRTIFSQKPDRSEFFTKTLERRLESAEHLMNGPPSAVLLGHIYGDQPSDGQSGCGEPSECTRLIVERYTGRSCVIVNFGQTQIERGAASWQSMLAGVDVLQLNLGEMRRFLAGGGQRRTLKQIIEWLAERSVTAVVTLDRLGALGTYKDGKEHGTVFAWSLITSDDVRDPTGAGDAFAAGMASQLRGKSAPTFFDFREAIGVGRLWAAYACTTVAGPRAYPTPELLADFAKTIADTRGFHPVEELHGHRSEEILDLFDMAYQ